jgi:NAD(P)-dependent dehydrogenase (short-subunit alcohol dehydrogenase family)
MTTEQSPPSSHHRASDHDEGTDVTEPIDPISLGFRRGDVVVITGAASGIGRATALAAGGMGLSVCAWDINTVGVRTTADEITEAGGIAIAVTADIGSDDDVESGFDVAAELGLVRYLVNNAGPPSSTTMDYRDGLIASAGATQRVAAHWLASERPSSSALVNVVSVAGNLVGSGNEWYSSAKAAIMGYTRHLAAYHARDLRANAVAPGITDTPRLANLAASELGRHIVERNPLGRMGRPEEIGWAILFLLSPLASYINGVMLTVDGGWTICE